MNSTDRHSARRSVPGNAARMAVVAGALMFAMGLGSAVEQQRSRQALDFEFEDVNPRSESHGQKLGLRELYAERGLVLQFVASWCGPCREELPHLEELHASGRAPVVLVAADEHGYRESILIVAERRKLTAPILFVPIAEAEELARFYDYEILPATYLIDRTGRIQTSHQGAWSHRRLKTAIERLLRL